MHMEVFRIRGWDLMLRRWRWLDKTQLISSQQVGLGFSHGAGRYRSGEPLFSSPVCWILQRFINGFLIGEWDLIFPVRRWHHETQQ